MENAEMKTRSIRADEATLDKFKALSESFENQGECLASLITAYEISTAKHTLTEMKADIADYESHIQSIQEAFLHVLELNNNAEQRIKQEYALLLQSKDKTIAELQSRTEEIKTAAAEAQEEAKAEIMKIQAAADQRAADQREAEEEAAKLRTVNSTLEQQSRLYEKLAEDKAATIERLQGNIAELQPVKTKYIALQEEHEKQAAELQSLKAELERLRSESDYKAKLAEAEKKEAIAETKAAYMEKIDQLRAEKEELLEKLNTTPAPGAIAAEQESGNNADC